jgi:hypothetical protein
VYRSADDGRRRIATISQGTVMGEDGPQGEGVKDSLAFFLF